MIRASIVPTRPLRDSGSTVKPERQVPTQLRDSKSAAAYNPVVLLRGCTPIDLEVIFSHVYLPRITWNIEGLKSNDTALVPQLFPPNSKVSRLSTNAVGLYRVTATVAGAGGTNLRFHWHVRFIDLRVPNDPGDVDIGTLDIAYGKQYAATVDATALFGFTIKAVLSGAADAPYQYNKVTIGILQNLYQKSTDPDCKALHGIYYRIDREGFSIFTIKKGELAEPSPAVASPHLDADDAAEEFPFMHSGHVTIEPTVGSVRSIKLSDEPGVLLPMYFDSTASTDRKVWRNITDLSPSKETRTIYALCGVGGRLKFISAVAAFSIEAKFNYVVFAKYNFLMQANAGGLVDRRTPHPFIDPAKLGIPKRSACFQLVSSSALPTPADARDANMETYGPVATKGGSTYIWTSL